MWIIWWALNNASKWQMGFNSAFKGLILVSTLTDYVYEILGFLLLLFYGILRRVLR
jgi:hypothetical protein